MNVSKKSLMNSDLSYNKSTFLRILLFYVLSLHKESTTHNMIVTFEKEYLKRLYENGVSEKKHRFQPNIIERYKRCIDYLKSSNKIEDLYLLSSLNYKVLSGDKSGISSIRVNNQYRIEFVVTESVVTICNILELSNHYK